MSITNFIPEVWSSEVLLKLRDALKYAQPGLINRDYEGEISQAGDTVHITDFDDISVSSYTPNPGSPIAYGTLSDNTRAFVVAQKDYFAFQVDDVDKRQALKTFMPAVMQGAAWQMAKKVDTYVSTKMAAGVDSGNQVGSVTVHLGPNSGDTEPAGDLEAYQLFTDFRTKLNRSDVPTEGRFAVVPPELYAYLLQDKRFIEAQRAGTTEGLRNGNVGNILGFTVIESNTVPVASGVYTILAGHSIATTFADQIVETEALRLQSQFADAVRGLHVYDSMVVRPTALASALVTLA